MVIKDTDSLGGVFFFILLRKEKVLGRGQVCGPGLSCMAGVKNKLPFIIMGSFIDQGMLERDRTHLRTEEKSILDKRLVRGAAIRKQDDNPRVGKKVDWTKVKGVQLYGQETP